jgi:epoxyqueuosine reductase
MDVDGTLVASEVSALLDAHGVDGWGVAARDAKWLAAPPLPRAIAFLLRLQPASHDGLDMGPTAAYVAEYRRLNDTLVEIGEALVDVLGSGGYRAVRVDDDAPDGPDDPPVFASKTAATQSGLGWIGKTALLVTHDWGSAVRLGTVFTDLPLSAGDPITQSRCGACRTCVDACPAGAGRDVAWCAGMSREILYDSVACERHLRRYPEFDEICGICIWVCPYSRRGL